MFVLFLYRKLYRRKTDGVTPLPLRLGVFAESDRGRGEVADRRENDGSEMRLKLVVEPRVVQVVVHSDRGDGLL
jgi:hypothetical protein